MILICDEGYQSSLAAATLRRFGIDATDVIGGVQSWRNEGLRLSPSSATHWRRAYRERGTEELSWTEPLPHISLELIQEAALPLDAAIIDVGGGASRLAGELLRAGHSDLTVADVAPEGLDRAKADLGEAAGEEVSWVEADVRAHDFDRRFDLWHDRALFHFMVSATDRDAYLAALDRALRPGGHLILATFGPRAQLVAAASPLAAMTPERSRKRSARASSSCPPDSWSIERHPGDRSSFFTRT